MKLKKIIGLLAVSLIVIVGCEKKHKEPSNIFLNLKEEGFKFSKTELTDIDLPIVYIEDDEVEIWVYIGLNEEDKKNVGFIMYYYDKRNKNHGGRVTDEGVKLATPDCEYYDKYTIEKYELK